MASVSVIVQQINGLYVGGCTKQIDCSKVKIISKKIFHIPLAPPIPEACLEEEETNPVDTVEVEVIDYQGQRWLINYVSPGIASVCGDITTGPVLTSQDVSLPLQVEDGILILPVADRNNDGYLSAEDYERFDDAAQWEPSTDGTGIKSKDGKDVGIGKDPLHPLSVDGDIEFSGVAYDNNCATTILNLSCDLQSAFVGPFAGNTTMTGTENAALGQYAGAQLSSGSNNVFLGKAAGYSVQVGSNNILIGRNILGSNASNQLNIGNWLTGNNGAISIPGSLVVGGVLQFASMTKAQRNALVSPQPGWGIFQTDNTPGLRVYNGAHWVKYTETNDD